MILTTFATEVITQYGHKNINPSPINDINIQLTSKEHNVVLNHCVNRTRAAYLLMEVDLTFGFNFSFFKMKTIKVSQQQTKT